MSFKEAGLNKDFRIDAEFFEKLPPENQNYQWVEIGEVLEAAQYGVSIDMNEEGMGFPIYRMNEIENMLCVEDVAKRANIELTDAAAFILSDRDVLFNRTNSQVFVGRTGLYKSLSGDPRIFASYLVRLKPRFEQVLPEYLVAFLNTYRGIRDVKRRARISINQSNVNAEEVKAVRLPLLSEDFQLGIKACFDDAHQKLIDSKKNLAVAEQTLLRALGLEGWQPPEPLTYTRRASEAFTAGRLDAEHYQERYYALAAKLCEYPLGCPTLGEICPTPVNGVEIREYCDDGTPYLRVGDLKSLDVQLESVKRVPESEANALIGKVALEKGDVLVSRSGSLAVTAVVENEWVNALISSHLIRVRLADKNYDPYFVALFLKTQPGRMQIEQRNNGAVQPEINQPSLKSILIPRLLMDDQQQIRNLVQRSRLARREARELLERAKRAVEIAIEENETAALRYLKQ